MSRSKITLITLILLLCFNKIDAQKALNFDLEASSKTIDFQFSEASDDAIKLVVEHLDAENVAHDLETNLTKSIKITHFLHKIWAKGVGEPFSNWHDPLTVAEKMTVGEAVDQKSLAAVLAACLIAENVPARLVFMRSLTRKNDQTYVVVEAWIRENQTWAICDPVHDFMPSEYGRPLPATELQVNIAQKRSLGNFILDSKTGTKKFVKCIRRSLQSFSVPLNFQLDDPGLGEVFLILLPRETEDLPDFLFKIYGKKTISTHSIVDFYQKPY